MLEDVIMLNQTKNGDELIKPPDDFPAIIVITCMLSVFSVVGTTGNAFVLYVFSRKKDKNTSTVFILALACIDFVTCSFVIPFTIFVEFMYKQVDNDAVCKIYQFFITSNVPFSAFIMVAIAFDRYFCICRPWMKFMNIRVAKRIILCLLTLALTLGLITSLAYGVYHRKLVTKVIRNVSREDINFNNQSVLAITVGSDLLLTNCSEELSETLNITCKDRNLNNWLLTRSLTPETPLHGRRNTSESINITLNTNDFAFTGFCFPNEAIFSIEFKRVYQKFYASLFLIAFIIVVILYGLIYRSILMRRSRRLQTSLTEKQQARMKSNVLNTIFSRKPDLPEAISMVSNNADVNKNNQGVGNTTHFRPVKCITVEPTLPVTEVTYCTPDYKTEITRATSEHSFYTVTAVDEMSTINDEEENKDEYTPLKEAVKENKLKVTTNNLSVPGPHNHHKRNRISKNAKNSIKKHSKRKDTNKRVSLDAVDSKQNIDSPNPAKETHRQATCNMYRQDTRKSVREKHRVANIKTAGILFIVTIVFILAFLPAWLMATKLIPPNMIVFYAYFIYNVANPVIYAFFNQSFQKEMRTVLVCRKKE